MKAGFIAANSKGTIIDRMACTWGKNHNHVGLMSKRDYFVYPRASDSEPSALWML